jgi:hypothetical protein
MRVYDPRLGKFLSVDPLTRDYPFYTPYQFAGNTPTKFIDLDGAEQYDRASKPTGVTHISIAKAPGIASQTRSVWLSNYEMRGIYGTNGAAYWIARYHYTESRYKGGYNDEWVVGPDGFSAIAGSPEGYHNRSGRIFNFGGGGRPFNVKSINEGWKEINTTPSKWITGVVALEGGIVAMGEANLVLNEMSNIARTEVTEAAATEATSVENTATPTLTPVALGK